MALITVAERVTFGASTEAQRAAWERRHYAPGANMDAARRAGGSGSLADAYAWGYVHGERARGRDDERDQRLMAVAAGFGAEYTHAAWLFETERISFRPGYMRAWEEALSAHGLI